MKIEMWVDEGDYIDLDHPDRVLIEEGLLFGRDAIRPYLRGAVLEYVDDAFAGSTSDRCAVVTRVSHEGDDEVEWRRYELSRVSWLVDDESRTAAIDVLGREQH